MADANLSQILGPNWQQQFESDPRAMMFGFLELPNGGILTRNRTVGADGADLAPMSYSYFKSPEDKVGYKFDEGGNFLQGYAANQNFELADLAKGAAMVGLGMVGGGALSGLASGAGALGGISSTFGFGGAPVGSGAGFVGEGAMSGIPAWDAAAAGGGLGGIAPSVALTPVEIGAGSSLVAPVTAEGAAALGGTGAMGAGGGSLLGAGAAAGGAGGLGSLASWAGPAASLIGGYMASNAAGKASDAQLQAAREAMALNEPFRQGGIKGMNRLLDLLGLSGNTSAEGYGSAAKDFSMTDFNADPGYQFRQQQGEQAIQRAASAAGRSDSGRAYKDLMSFNSGLASQEYGNAYNRYNTNRAAKLNPLQSLMGSGQSAANTVGEYRTQAGNAQAAGQVGSANAWTNALSGAIGSYQQNQLLDMLKSRGSMYAG